MDELLFKYDNNNFGIEINKTYLTIRLKDSTTQIPYEAIKMIVNLLKSLNKKNRLKVRHSTIKNDSGMQKNF